MVGKLNQVAFYLTLFCFGISCYSLYALIDHKWLVSPSNYFLLIGSAICLILGIIGIKERRSWKSIGRSFFSIILSLLLCIVLVISILISHFLGGNELFKTVKSADGHYVIDFYRWDEGATGTYGIRGELQGALWFKRSIYLEKETNIVSVDWKSNSKVVINGKELELSKGEVFYYEDR